MVTNKLCEIHAALPNNKNDLYSHAAKIYITTAKLWHTKIKRMKLLDRHETLGDEGQFFITYPSPEIDLTFEHFDFEGNPDFCKTVVVYGKAGRLNEETLNSLVSKFPNKKVPPDNENDLLKRIQLNEKTLKFLSSENKGNFLTSWDTEKKLALYHDLMTHCRQLVLILSEDKFNSIMKNLAGNLLSEIRAYEQAKKVLPKGEYTRFYFFNSFTSGDKAEAATALISIFQPKNFDNPENLDNYKAHRKALTQGHLSKLARSFVAYLEERQQLVGNTQPSFTS